MRACQLRPLALRTGLRAHGGLGGELAAAIRAAVLTRDEELAFGADGEALGFLVIRDRIVSGSYAAAFACHCPAK